MMAKICAPVSAVFLCMRLLVGRSNSNSPPTLTGQSLAALAAEVRPAFLPGSVASGLDFARADVAPRDAFFFRNFKIMTAGV